MAARGQTCVCGHQREMHQHMRSGTDCGTCGPQVCPAFRPSIPWYRLLLSRNNGPTSESPDRSLEHN